MRPTSRVTKNTKRSTAWALLVAAMTTSPVSALAQNNSCVTQNSPTIRLLGGGDVIYHGALLVQAMTEKKGFDSLWHGMQPFFKQADVIYANLEGPAARSVGPDGRDNPRASKDYVPDEGTYSLGTEGKSYTFNFHPEGVNAMRSWGNPGTRLVLSTANNHSFDRGSLGVDRTIELLNELDIPNYGTFHSKQKTPAHVVVEENGVRVAFVGCTYGSNRSGPSQQILGCFDKGAPNQRLIDEVRHARQQSDLVIFTPHWGTEYSKSAHVSQKQLAQAVLDAGARVILGHHPHVLQPVEIQNASEPRRMTVTAFSIGNFITNQHPYDLRDVQKHEERFPQRVSVLVALRLAKIGGDIEIQSLKFLPTYMTTSHENRRQGRTLVPAFPELYPANSTLKRSVEKAFGQIQSLIPASYLAGRDQTEGLFNDCLRKSP